MVLFLIFLNVTALLHFVRKYSIYKGSVEVNHVTLFSLGFFLYWIMPVLVSEIGFMSDEGISIWGNLYNSISLTSRAVYLIVCLTCYLSFVFGTTFNFKFGDGMPKNDGLNLT